jgi:transcriptional regulator with XRE-family HTH domain
VTFGELLHKTLKDRGLSYAAFARLVGVKPPLVFAIRSGKQRIPKARIAAWADRLDLTGKERVHFLDEAWLSHASEHVRDLVQRLRQDHARHQKVKRAR